MSNLNKELLYQIKSELLKDEYAAYVKDGRHYDLANKLNDTLVDIDEPVSVSELNSFADTHGLLIEIEDVIVDEKYPTEIKKAARQVLRVFSGRYPTVDLTLEKVQLVFGALVQANVLTQEIVDLIFALGKKKIPQSVYKFGVLLGSEDIAAALNL